LKSDDGEPILFYSEDKQIGNDDIIEHLDLNKGGKKKDIVGLTFRHRIYTEFGTEEFNDQM
jgi:hypothetical protein